MRMPRTSSLSRPSSSTSSLSNWLIGKPSQLASTGVRSSRVRSDSSTPHGCSATWRGSPSRRATSRNSRSSPPRPPSREARSSGSSLERQVHVAGPDVRERLGDLVDLAGRHAERGADVADRVAHPVGVHHRDAGDPLAAEALEDLLVDLGTSRRLDVDVDVGQRLAQRREEALHQQAVAHRVDPGDAEQVVDQAARAGPAGGDPHPHVADQVDDVGDGEEVRRVAELLDDAELVVEPPAHLRGGGHRASAQPGLAPLPQHRLRGADRVGDRAVRPQHLEVGEVHLAHPEVGPRVDGAPVGHPPGRREQPAAPPGRRARPPTRPPRRPAPSPCRT